MASLIVKVLCEALLAVGGRPNFFENDLAFKRFENSMNGISGKTSLTYILQALSNHVYQGIFYKFSVHFSYKTF